MQRAAFVPAEYSTFIRESGRLTCLDSISQLARSGGYFEHSKLENFLTQHHVTLLYEQRHPTDEMRQQTFARLRKASAGCPTFSEPSAPKIQMHSLHMSIATGHM